MSVSTGACCAALLQQQQQTIQHHEHCDQAVEQCDKPVNQKAVNDQVTIASDHSAPKQCTVVEHGRVVVKEVPPTDGTDDTHASKRQRQ